MIELKILRNTAANWLRVFTCEQLVQKRTNVSICLWFVEVIDNSAIVFNSSLAFFLRFDFPHFCIVLMKSYKEQFRFPNDTEPIIFHSPATHKGRSGNDQDNVIQMPTFQRQVLSFLLVITFKVPWLWLPLIFAFIVHQHSSFCSRTSSASSLLRQSNLYRYSLISLYCHSDSIFLYFKFSNLKVSIVNLYSYSLYKTFYSVSYRFQLFIRFMHPKTQQSRL